MNHMLYTALIVLPPLLVAIILHEIAHGWSAEKFGDPTARTLGRITLNPMVHIDPFMTVMVPLFLILVQSPIVFGGAKPVPVNPLNFPNPRRDMVWVALAGPATNFVLAILAVLFFQILKYTPLLEVFPTGAGILIVKWTLYSVLINIVLGTFNLLPIPPLDGGRIAVGILPIRFARALSRLEPIGILIVVALLATGVLDAILSPIVEFTAQHILK